ncbi:ATP-dependent protease ATPase subunit HslU [Balneolaceae bacterium YR4-1]|uniref:ATP-dependent protease ATPase subunit HslU n=1 Tax=Halalkalibaculum roseum TaxID=2709311 RepID=A0A6M1T2E9_9BACT|nr:ATP-dependent protease ATPase subunit HslU [Halalkalibaculum roseum]NGP76937.1 ATP-dependent protease ATPase subunit HslU [Halalkalibaculum roseum]
MQQQLVKPKNLTPQQVVAELQKYIVGQDDAKRSVAIALRNRWRRMNSDEEIRDEILPNNILLIGPTGVGKTEIARRLAKLAEAPFLKIEASKFTEVGYVGRDVESMIRDLADIAVNMVKSEMQERVQEKAKEIVEERILDILIPPVKKSSDSSTGFKNDGDSDFDPDRASDQELNQRTREKFRQKLRDGELDDRKIEIEVKKSSKAPMMQIFGPQGGMDEMGINLQDMLGNLSGDKKSKRNVTIEEARKILLDEEAEKLVDHDAAVQEALERVQTQGIVFIDELDKVATSSGDGKGGGPDVSRQGVQRDLLPIVEGSNVSTKHGMVKTDHILFIGSGAFHVSKPSDLIPELQGRFPIRVELNSLTEDDFFDILTQPKNALTKQYQAMLEAEGVKIDFTEEAIREIASIAAQVNERVENIGARRLHTILSSLLDELLFAVPDDISSGDITIDKEYVNKQLDDLVKDKDLSHYIL